MRTSALLVIAWAGLVIASVVAGYAMASPVPSAGLLVLSVVPVLLLRRRGVAVVVACASAAWLLLPLVLDPNTRDVGQIASRVIGATIVLALMAIAGAYARVVRKARLREARLRTLVDGAACLVWRGRPRRGGERAIGERLPVLVGHVDTEWQLFTGQRIDEARGEGWTKCLHEDDRERVREAWRQPDPDAWPERYDDTVRVWHATSQSYRFMDVRLRPVRIDDDVVEWVGVFVDAHARRVATHALALGDERSREAQRLARLGTWEYDPTTDRLWISAELSAAFGGELVADSIELDELLRYLPGTPADRIDGLITSTLAGQNIPEDEYPLLLPDGVRRVARIVAHRGANSAGQPIVWGIAQDVSERVRTREREQALEAKLAHAVKMQTVGEMSSGIAHDFNNVLTSLLGYGELVAARMVGGDPEVASYLARMLAAGRRGRDLLRTLLVVGRGQPAATSSEAPVPSDVGEIVADAVNLVRVAMPGGIRIDEDIASEARACCSRSALQEAVLNLCVNARDALGESGHIRVTVDAGHASGECAACGEALQGVAVVCVSVEDDGPGIDPSVLPRVFEPFFSTKRAGEGTGLGLAMVARLLHAEGGHVRVETRPGRTRFELLLPVEPTRARLPTPIALPPVVDATAPDAPARYRVLVLDDEAPIGRLMASAFEQSGVAAVVFADAHEAQAAFVANPERFDLVVTDLTMPAMSGIEFATAIRRHRDVPTLLVTGGGTPDEELYATGAFDQVLRKPFTMRELLTSALQLIQARAPTARTQVH